MNPVLAAMLEDLATKLTGLAATYAGGNLSDNDAVNLLNDILEAVVPGDDETPKATT